MKYLRFLFFGFFCNFLIAEDYCNVVSTPEGVSKITISHQNLEREYRVYVPKSYTGNRSLPVVLNFHGTGSSADKQAEYSGMDELSEELDFIHINPQGKNLNGRPVFNAGLTMNSPTNKRDFSLEPRDDVSFAKAIIKDVSSKICVDSNRIYATGMSNGGRMSYRLGCEAADVFAAIAPVAGVLSLEPKDCNPSRSIPTLSFHGTSDFVSKYDRPGGFSTMSAPDMLKLWAKKNQCSSNSEITFKKKDISCESYKSCGNEKGEVTLCTVINGGHCWPGKPCWSGASYTINASKKIIDFFYRFSLND